MQTPARPELQDQQASRMQSCGPSLPFLLAGRQAPEYAEVGEDAFFNALGRA